MQLIHFRCFTCLSDLILLKSRFSSEYVRVSFTCLSDLILLKLAGTCCCESLGFTCLSDLILLKYILYTIRCTRSFYLPV